MNKSDGVCGEGKPSSCDETKQKEIILIASVKKKKKNA